MTPVLTVLSCTLLLSAAITIRNNGYEDITVAIHKDVPQDNKIIEEIQAMFRDASPFLYESLEKRVYFRNVTILVPSTWTRDSSWTTDDSLTFKDADIRVDRPSPLHGSDPYVFQPGQCGEHGRYIHFTPEFILNRNSFRDINYGNAGRVLVHEFAHYRYGVFNEYGLQGSRYFPMWYLDGRRARPTGCSDNVKGTGVQGDSVCYSMNQKGLPTDDCIFIPEFETDSIRASIMAYHYLESVTKFCKTDSDEKEQHNYWAPNQHNMMCRRKATYDVIMSHPDFRLGNSPREDMNITPSFVIVQSPNVTVTGERCGRRTVLVLDTSGSMRSNQKYFKLAQAGDRLIRDILPNGTDLGIVTFSSSARVKTEMTLITDDAVRDSMASSLPTLQDVGGGTWISAGLSTALQVLRRNGKETKGANIVLVTDGETSEDLPKVSLPSLIAAKVRVHSIGLGSQAEDTIANLSIKTGGTFSYYSEASTSTDLDSAMERLLEFVATCENVGGIEIERLGFLMNRTISPFKGAIDVDDSVGKNTLFSFAFPQGVTMTVTVNDPDDKVYNSTSPEYSLTESLNIVRFRFPFAMEGRWTYTIETASSSSQLVIVVAKSTVRDDVQAPIESETRLNTASLDLTDPQAIPVLYTYIHRGYDPVIRANVTVTVDRTPDPSVTFNLWDDGILPDSREFDGVYTGYFTQFTGNQRISMQIRVQNIPGQTAFVVDGGVGSSGAASIYRNTTANLQLEPAGNFTRTASPGAVDVKGFNTGTDLFPPGSVSDLNIVTFDKKAKTVTLNWTSPGDDYNEGTVDRYELRVAGEFQTLVYNYTTARLITNADLKNSSMVPLKAGSPHQLVLVVPSSWSFDSFIFGLKAFDEANKSSDLSNLPSVTFKGVIFPEGPPPVPEADVLGVHVPVAVIIAAVIGGVIVLLVVILVLIAVFCCRKNPKPSKPKETVRL